MKITKKNALTTLITGIIAILIFSCAIFADRKLYPTFVIDDLSAAELNGFDRYGEGRMRSMEYEPSLEIRGLSQRVRRIDVVVNQIGSEDKNYPRTLRIYPGNGSYSFYTSDAAHLSEGVNRFVFHTGKAPVTELRLDFTGMHGKLLDIDQIVINPDAFSNLPFLAAAALLFLLAAAELSLMLSPAGAFWFSAAFFSVFAAGAAALLSVPGMKVQPMFLFLAAGMLLILFFFCCDLAPGRYGWYLLTLLAVTFIIASWWALAAPMGEGPDEGMHMDVAYYIYRHGALPRGDNPEIRNPVWGISYAYSPILPFIIGAGFMKAASVMGAAEDSLYIAARFVSVAAGVLTVLFSALASRELFSKKNRMMYLFPLLIAFFPEMMHLRTYVNSDAFGIMTTAMIVLAWAKGKKHGWRIRDAVFLAVSLGLCALTYYNCYGFILLSIPFFFLTDGGRRSARGKKTAEKAVIIVLITFAVCGWWFIRNAVIYHGDILGRAALKNAGELYAAPGYRPSDRVTPMSSGLTLLQMFTETEWLKETLTSFVGRFSNFRLQVEMPVVRLSLIIMAASLLFNLRFPLSLRRSKKSQRAGIEFSDFQMSPVCQLILLAAMLIPAGLTVYYSYTNDYQPQGRYLMPMIVPLVYFLCQGLDETGNFLYKIFVRKTSPEERSYAGAAATAAAGFAAAAITRVLLITVYRFYIS